MDAPHALLGILQLGSNYGYELKRTYDDLLGQDKPLAYGQVYATLGRLKRDEKVREVEAAEPGSGPDRVRYAITDLGIAELEQWLATPEPPAPHLQATLYLKTVIALLREGDSAHYLDAQRSAHIARMRELTHQRATSSPGKTLLIDHAIFHLEADLRWIELTSSRLAELKEELCQSSSAPKM